MLARTRTRGSSRTGARNALRTLRQGVDRQGESTRRRRRSRPRCTRRRARPEPRRGHADLRHVEADRSREDLAQQEHRLRLLAGRGTNQRLAEVQTRAASRRAQREGARHADRRGVRPSEPPDEAPDLLLTTNPDAAHPDTWIRIFMNTKGAINYLECSDPTADADMDKGLNDDQEPTSTRTTARPATRSRRRVASSPSPT